MDATTLRRRRFLQMAAMAAAGGAVIACGPPAAQQKPTAAAPAATTAAGPAAKPTEPPKPAADDRRRGAAPTAAPTTAPAAAPAAGKYKEAPLLADLVKAGKLPAVEQRLPASPRVLKPLEEIGQYGGTWRRGLPRPLRPRRPSTKLMEENAHRVGRARSEHAQRHPERRREVGADRRRHRVHLLPAQGHASGRTAIEVTTDDVKFCVGGRPWATRIWCQPAPPT